jgi:hypothetical protein
MGYQPDPANQPSPPLDNYDSASETSPPLEEVLAAADPSRHSAAEADPAQDGPGVYSWDTLDEQGRPTRRAIARSATAEAGAASTYNAGYSDRQA